MQKRKFLTIEEKRELIRQGKKAPICMSDSFSKASFIAKLRNIHDGSLTNKRIKL